MRMVRRGSSFTLIELLVVIATISIILAILIPSISTGRNSAQRQICASNLSEIYKAFSYYCSDYDGIYPAAEDPVVPSYNIWLWMGRGWREFIKWYIDNTISADNPSILHCPAESTPKYESTSYGYSMSFYHSPDQINSMKDKSYTYNPIYVVRPVGVGPEDLAYPAKKIMVGEWYSNHSRVTGDYKTEPGWWSWQGTRNFLFADGHINFVPAEQIREANDGWPDPNLTVDGYLGIDY